MGFIDSYKRLEKLCGEIMDDAYTNRTDGTEGYTDDVDLNAYTDNGYNENGYYEQSYTEDSGYQDPNAGTGYIDQGYVAQEYVDQEYANQGGTEGADAQNGVLQQAYY